MERKIWFYLITPHSTAGVCPFILLRKRFPRCEFCLDSVRGLSKDKVDHFETVVSRVSSKQGHMKGLFDRNNKVKLVEVKISDWVIVKLLTRVKKGKSKLSRPVWVLETAKGSVCLQDKRWWSKRDVVKISREQPIKILKMKNGNVGQGYDFVGDGVGSTGKCSNVGSNLLTSGTDGGSAQGVVVRENIENVSDVPESSANNTFGSQLGRVSRNVVTSVKFRDYFVS